MGVRMTREEFLEKVFRKKYEELKMDELRVVRVKVKGKEISLAQLIGSSETRIYQNLALSCFISLAMIILSALGFISALAGSILHNLGAFVVLINSSRILKTELWDAKEK